MPAPFLSEIKYLGPGAQDFVEVVLDEGADSSGVQIVIYNPNGTIRSTNDLGSVVGTIAGDDIYVVEAAINKNGAVALVVDGTVTSFVSFARVVDATEGPASGSSSTQIGESGSQNESLVSTDGVNFSDQTPPDPGVVPCFLKGTLIETDQGLRPIEDLHVGDRILTAEGDFAAIEWIASRKLDIQGSRERHLLPILIPKGSLGKDTPERDLIVSPSHRVLLRAPVFNLMFFSSDVLVPARHLVGTNGIRVCTHIRQPEYFHILFEEHELVWSEGALTESFHPSVAAASGFAKEAQEELRSLFPELFSNPISIGPVHSYCLKSFETHAALHSSDWQGVGRFADTGYGGSHLL